MRSVNITGKHNIDKLNKIDDPIYKPIRKHMTDFDELLNNHEKQLDLIRELYIDYGITSEDTNNDISNANTIKVDPIKTRLKSELHNKIQGYKYQDMNKDIFNLDTLINLEDLLEKLLGSKLKCYYCNKPVSVLYKNVREPQQWTLDRIDNDLSHTKDNTCIACLKCNLQRRLMDAKKFTFTKQLKINKV
jgi:hypothetical protein